MHQPWPESDQEPLPPPGADHLTLVRWMASLPCNRDGADKTWVVTAMRNARQVRAVARSLHEDASLATHPDVLERLFEDEACISMNIQGHVS